VTEEIDIYRTAKFLIDQHGEDAPIHAAMRADKLLDAGELDGYGVWKRIVAAINEMQKNRTDEALH